MNSPLVLGSRDGCLAIYNFVNQWWTTEKFCAGSSPENANLWFATIRANRVRCPQEIVRSVTCIGCLASAGFSAAYDAQEIP